MASFRLFVACLGVLGSFTLQAQSNKSYPASPFPDRVILGWKGDPAHSQAVSWRTDVSVATAVGAIHEADPSPDFVPQAQQVPAKSETVTIEGVTVKYHWVNFTDLKPGTQYVYRVGDGEHWSEWFHFTTAQEKPAPVSFLYFGDAQNELRSLWSRAIRGAYATLPQANLMIHAGDLINNANTDYQWGEWFEAGGWINGMVPNLLAPGNHEYFKDTDDKRRISLHWRPSFALPENGPKRLPETAYYLDYQGIRFITLDSQAALLDSSILEEQAQWLLQTLKNNPNRWTIVIHHHPIYSTKNGRDNDEWRARMEPIYRSHKVDLVLQGHDHTYGRGLNMPLGQSRKVPDGPVYVVSVSGPKMYDIGLQNWMDRAASNTQLYQTVHVDDNKLAYKAFTVTGSLYDSFELIKDKKGKNTLVDLAPALPQQELLDLPERLLKRFKAEELEEYNQRFRDYKTRKAATKK